MTTTDADPDFDTAILGHGRTMTKQEVRATYAVRGDEPPDEGPH
jgi:hypothetical protein